MTPTEPGLRDPVAKWHAELYSSLVYGRDHLAPYRILQPLR
jgi:hypothetical protein